MAAASQCTPTRLLTTAPCCQAATAPASAACLATAGGSQLMHASWRPACSRGAGPPTAPQSGHPLAHQSRPPPPLLPPGPPGHQQHSTLQTPARQRRPPPAAAHATRRAAPVPRRRQRRGRRAGCWRAGRWGRQQCKPGIVAAPPRPAALKRTGGGTRMGWCGRCRGQRSCGGWAGVGEAK